MPPSLPHLLVLFDGECNLCNRSVQFVLDHESDDHTHFAASQSALGQVVLRRHGLPSPPGSVVVVDGAHAHTKSAATIRLARHLRFPWNLLRLMVVIPAPVRDLFYDWIAANRYWISRQLPTCRIGSPELMSRFVKV